ncbi:MAG TPA: hypothetical protein VIG99_22830, partial [Myxococcaceae bacterium]
MKSVGAVEFFTDTADGTLWAPTQAWAIAKPNSKEEWTLTLETPQPEDGPSRPLHDLKRWLLFDDRDKRFLVVSQTKDSTLTRRIQRDDAAVRYLKMWQERVPATRRRGRFNVLMPAVDDESARKRYLDVIRRA